jgi:hypothetical protein
MKTPVAVKIDTKVLARLRALTTKSKDPYAPKLSQLLERGAVLAMNEYEETKKNGK